MPQKSARPGDRLVDAAFVQHHGGVREELGMRLDQPAGAFAAARLLVGDGEKDDRTAARLRRARELEERHQVGDAEPFGVDRAAPPELARMHFAAVRRVSPPGSRRHRVDVMQEEERARAGSCGGRFETRVQTHPAARRDQQL